jgi:nucleoside-diphosphate-sugar epimerase
LSSQGILPCDLKIGISISDLIKSSEFAEVEAVIHCAATQLFTPNCNLYSYDTFHQTNVVALEELLNACIEVGVKKFIHISTDMVYGIPKGSPFCESDELRPVGYYGISKCRAEDLVQAAAKKIPVVTILRPRIIGGFGRAGLFSLMAFLLKRRLPIPLFGSGRNLYQMIHVEDLAELIIEALNSDIPGIYNAGSLEVSSMVEKISIASECLKIKPIIISIPESLAVTASSFLYKLHLGPLHPEQYLTAGRDFVLSMERTLSHFKFRPQYSDNEIIRDSFRRFTEESVVITV